MVRSTLRAGEQSRGSDGGARGELKERDPEFLQRENAERDPPVEESEAFRVLGAEFDGAFGDIPVEFIVHAVFRSAAEGGWNVLRAAMQALERRFKFAERDELRVGARPSSRRIFGEYELRRKGSGSRPYRTLLASLDPLEASCDCPDFLRSSLGLCKHILVVLNDLASKPRRWKLALEADGPGEPVALAPVRWLPVRPFRGAADALERIVWLETDVHASSTRAWSRAGHLFERDRTADGSPRLRLRPAAFARPESRAETISLLLELVRAAERRRTGPVQDPAVRALLEEERERLSACELEVAKGKELSAALDGLRRRLYPYQLEAVRTFLRRGRLLLADDMGLGKTAQATACCHSLARAGRVRRGLLIVPASLKPQWIREWRLFTDLPIEVVDGPASARRGLYEKTRNGFLVANYEQVLRDLDTMRAWNPDIVVLDEAQRIKNWATKTAAGVKQLSPRYRLVLTGTPLENRLEELASILDWVDDRALEPKWRLEPWHFGYSGGEGGGRVIRELDTLRQRLAPSMLRRRRAEVLKQLPARTDVVVPVPMTAEQIDEHDALVQPIQSLLRWAEKRPLTQAEFLRLMQLFTAQRMISNGLAQVRFGTVWPEISSVRNPSVETVRSLSSPKLLALREIIEQVLEEDGRKVVIFSQWRRMLLLANWAISGLLDTHHARAVFFTGKESQARRTANIVDFHDDPSARVLFCTDAGGVGLNLQRAATTCINLELPWNPAVLEQRIGRIHRLGQENPVTIYNLICERGIESRIAFLVDSKRMLFEGLFDGTSDEIAFDSGGGLFAKLREVVDVADEHRARRGKPGGESAPPDLEPDEDALEELDDVEIFAAVDDTEDFAGAAGGGEEVPESASEQSSPGVTGTLAPRAGGTRQLPYDKARDEDRSEPGGRTPSAAESIRGVFDRIEWHRRADGSVRIEAPAETADALAALFEGAAQIFREVARH